MTLAALQADFRATVLGDDKHPGFAVYRGTYRAQLMACLTDTFPAVVAWLGDNAFHTEAARFIDAHPPSSWSLDHYPAGFADWLVGQNEAVAAELAAIEWALATSFVGPDEAVLTVADLAGVDWDNAQLAPSAACRILALSGNAAGIWAAIQLGETPPEPALEPQTVLIWRQQQQCQLRVVAPLEAAMLARGAFAFADLCTAAVAHHGEDEGIAVAGALLAQWAQDECMRRPD